MSNPASALNPASKPDHINRFILLSIKRVSLVAAEVDRTAV